MRKSSFLTFCFAFLPGAGEMYLGMMKKGLTIMCVFWSISGVSMFLRLEFLMMLMPVLFFYSFFDTFNIKWLTPEQRQELDDRFGEHLSKLLFGDTPFTMSDRYKGLVARRHTLFGWGAILLGSYLILRNFLQPILHRFIEQYELWFLDTMLSRVPSAIVAVLVICLGVHLLRGGKKASLPDDREPEYVEYKGDRHDD